MKLQTQTVPPEQNFSCYCFCQPASCFCTNLSDITRYIELKENEMKKAGLIVVALLASNMAMAQYGEPESTATPAHPAMPSSHPTINPGSTATPPTSSPPARPADHPTMGTSGQTTIPTTPPVANHPVMPSDHPMMNRNTNAATPARPADHPTMNPNNNAATPARPADHPTRARPSTKPGKVIKQPESAVPQAPQVNHPAMPATHPMMNPADTPPSTPPNTPKY